MAAGPWVVHNKAIQYIVSGVVDLDGASYKMALFGSGSNVGDPAVDAFASATGEIAGGSGYTAGGVGVLSPSISESAGVVNFDADDVVFSASGGDITARYAVIYADSVAAPVAKPIVAHMLLDAAPADVTATDGNTLTVEMPAQGLFGFERA